MYSFCLILNKNLYLIPSRRGGGKCCGCRTCYINIEAKSATWGRSDELDRSGAGEIAEAGEWSVKENIEGTNICSRGRNEW